MLYLFGCTSESKFWDHLIQRNDSQKDFSQSLKEKGLQDFAILVNLSSLGMLLV